MWGAQGRNMGGGNRMVTLEVLIIGAGATGEYAAGTANPKIAIRTPVSCYISV